MESDCNLVKGMCYDLHESILTWSSLSMTTEQIAVLRPLGNRRKTFRAIDTKALKRAQWGNIVLGFLSNKLNSTSCSLQHFTIKFLSLEDHKCRKEHSIYLSFAWNLIGRRHVVHGIWQWKRTMHSPSSQEHLNTIASSHYALSIWNSQMNLRTFTWFQAFPKPRNQIETCSKQKPPIKTRNFQMWPPPFNFK